MTSRLRCGALLSSTAEVVRLTCEDGGWFSFAERCWGMDVGAVGIPVDGAAAGLEARGEVGRGGAGVVHGGGRRRCCVPGRRHRCCSCGCSGSR